MTRASDEPPRGERTQDRFRTHSNDEAPRRSAGDGAGSSVTPPASVAVVTASDAGPPPADWPGEGTAATIVPGQVLFGRYQVLRRLGRGGMGEVWLVRHVELGVERALKLILPQFLVQEAIRVRFAREARVTARFGHPNIVVVHDAQLSGDAASIEMEFVRGHSLNQLLRAGVPMPLDWVGRILDQLGDALQVAHEHHVVHRDLKPSNLMLVDGRPPGQEFLKVLDFGIAKILGSDNRDSGGRTMTEGFLGTVPYASPEQLQEQPVDGRSDLYATGVILYELLTGHRPFGGSALEQMHAHVHLPPPPMRLKNPRANVPPEVERVVMRCLAKDPAQRPQSPRELAEEFRRALSRTVLPPSPPGHPRMWRVALLGLVAALVCLALVLPRRIFDPTDSPPRMIQQPGPGGRDSTPGRPEFDVELRTNRPDNVFAPGDELVITVVNREDRDLFLRLIGTDVRGAETILAPGTTIVPAGQSFRYPSDGALRIRPEPGQEQITAFVSDTAFPPGGSQPDQDMTGRVVKKSIAIRTR